MMEEYILITGASSGIGESFAAGYDLRIPFILINIAVTMASAVSIRSLKVVYQLFDSCILQNDFFVFIEQVQTGNGS